MVGEFYSQSLKDNLTQKEKEQRTRWVNQYLEEVMAGIER